MLRLDRLGIHKTLIELSWCFYLFLNFPTPSVTARVAGCQGLTASASTTHKKNKTMRNFEIAIKAMLDKQAAEDELFAVHYAKENKNVPECCRYIISTVREMGASALTDEEVLGIAIHYYDEDDLEVKEAPSCRVVIPSTPEIEEARKVALTIEAEERYIREMMAEMKKTGMKKPKGAKPQVPSPAMQELF